MPTNSTSPTNLLSETDLTAALRAEAEGYLPAEAAVELLIDQKDWLSSAGLREFVDYSDDPAETGGSPMARVRWADAVAALDSGQLPSSGAAARILRIAASFGGGVPVDLRETMSTSLGHAHADFVIRAVKHALES